LGARMLVSCSEKVRKGASPWNETEKTGSALLLFRLGWLRKGQIAIFFEVQE
jgi:hypothetical protein